MGENRARGFIEGDDMFFSAAKLPKLRMAQEELQFLLDRSYPSKSAMTFVGNRHQLTVRQALAVTRATSSSEKLKCRKNKELSPEGVRGQILYIDGFNLIITLEVALSDGMLFVGMDGCIRDLAELRGSYRLMPKTDGAIGLVYDALLKLGALEAVIYLDKPVSNSGRLKQKIYELSPPIPISVDIISNPDNMLKERGQVVTGDSVVLDSCSSWFNMTAYILGENAFAKNLTRLIRLDGK